MHLFSLLGSRYNRLRFRADAQLRIIAIVIFVVFVMDISVSIILVIICQPLVDCFLAFAFFCLCYNKLYLFCKLFVSLYIKENYGSKAYDSLHVIFAVFCLVSRASLRFVPFFIVFGFLIAPVVGTIVSSSISGSGF